MGKRMIVLLLLFILIFNNSAIAGIPQDKKKHFVLGLVTSIPTIFIKCTPVTGLAVSFSIGFLKELKDGIQNHSAIRRGREPIHAVEAKDMHATGIGGIISFIIKLIIGG